MNRARNVCCWMLVAAVGCSLAVAQEKKPEGKASQPAKGKPEGQPTQPGQMPEMTPEDMAWMKAGMPGPEHQVLNYMIGNWDVTSKMWQQPDSAPMESKATGKAEWVYGGRFVKFDYKGDMMGMPFEGGGYEGYDNIKKAYVSIWLDTMSTGFMNHTGTYDAATKTFNWSGECTDPMGGIFKSRNVVKIINDNEHVMTFYHTKAGEKEIKVMELAYKRAGGGTTAPAAK